MSIVGVLNKELDNLETEHGIEMSAVISRSGVPIAWHITKEASAETVATLSATIFGASEVIYTSQGRQPPQRVIVESEDGGAMITCSLGKKALLILMSMNVNSNQLTTVAETASRKIRDVLLNE
jgi:predicted regulator of Ras-like GTPase activity (Roadblock/LC7/MglB family)